MKISLQGDQAISPADRYFTMIQTIVPRPIAWVLSRNEAGQTNLAPFSYFVGICSDPALAVLSVGHKKDGERKDSWRNLEQSKDIIIHIPSENHAQAVTDSAYEFAYGDSELEALGLKTEPVFSGTDLPMIEDIAVAYHARWHSTQEIGPTKQGLIIVELLELYLRDDIHSTERGRLTIDAKKLNPLCRLGGSDYATLGEIITVPRARKQPGSN